MKNEQMSPLTKSQLETVLHVLEKTGVLTCRDKQTYPASRARDYGEEWVPVTPTERGFNRPNRTKRKMRVIEMWHTDSPICPGGIPVGVTRTFQQHQAEGQGLDFSMRFISAKSDMSYSQQKQVRAWAYGKRWLTDEQRTQDEIRKARLRAKRAEDELDPSSAIGRSVADNIAAAIAKATSGQAAEAPAATAVVEAPPPVAEVSFSDPEPAPPVKKTRRRRKKAEPKPEESEE